MRIMNSKLAKVMLIGALLIGAASALQMNIPTQYRKVAEGQPAQYKAVITNDGTETTEVALSWESDISISVEDDLFTLDPNETREISVFALSDGEGEGTYSTTLYANNQVESFATQVEAGAPSLSLVNSYGEITVEQGSSHKIKLIARNTGNTKIENIVFKSDLSEKFNAEHPDSFDLEPGESREVSILVNIPEEYPKGEYTYTVKAASGSLKATSEVDLNIVKSLPIKERLSLNALEPWRKLVKDGEDQGYEVPFEVRNKGLTDIEEVDWEVKGIPSDWKVTGDDEVTVKGGQVIQQTLKIDSNGDYSPTTAEVQLVKDGIVITSKEIELQGSEVGETAATGMVIGSTASLTLGIAVLLALVFLILYVRERNLSRTHLKKESDEEYLEKLVKETVEKEEKKSKE